MSSGTTVVVIVAILVVIALLGAAGIAARRRRLRQQFGPEYERVASEQNSRIRADAELTGRQRRVRKLDIKPLPAEARTRFADRWVGIQEEFVDAPQSAVQEAYALVTSVMQERGYPIDDEQQVMADLSVEHAQTVGHFRAAQEISASAASGDAATEDLRQALIHYRALFSDLLGEPDGVVGQAMKTSNGAAASTTVLADHAVPADNVVPADSIPADDAMPNERDAGNGLAGAANGQVDSHAGRNGYADTSAQDQADYPQRYQGGKE
jgi:hypothetical protein